MSKLKLRKNVNPPQLLCIAVFVAQNGEFQQFGRFCVDCYYTLYYGLPMVIRVKQLIAVSMLFTSTFEHKILAEINTLP